MSEHDYPVIVCDGDDGMCAAVELDHTGHGLGTIVGSETQLPDGWTGPKPGRGSDEPHLCPDCAREAAEATR